MHSIKHNYHKKEWSGKGLLNSDRGFVLVLAVLGVAVIMAIGILALTMSGRDITISSRVVGEQKAFAACESGVHYVTTILDPSTSGWVSDWIPVDPSNDPASGFRSEEPVPPSSGSGMLPLAGYSIGGGQTWGQTRYNVIVEGRNTNHKSLAQVEVGLGYGPIEMSTISR